MIVQCATFSKSLNPQNIVETFSDIRFRIQFPFESSFWISVSCCKLAILPDIQPANRIVIISGLCMHRAIFQRWYRIRSARFNSGRILTFSFGPRSGPGVRAVGTAPLTPRPGRPQPCLGAPPQLQYFYCFTFLILKIIIYISMIK